MDPRQRRQPIRYLRGKLLGRGAYGTVSFGLITYGGSSLPIAIKSAAGKNATYLMREKMFLDLLVGCPQVVCCYGAAAVCTVADDGTGGRTSRYDVYIEFAPSGSLHDYLQRSSMPELIARLYTRSMLRGLVHIHRRGVVHCDIKPENVMLSDAPYEVKIIDFGLALLSCERLEPGRYRGTPHYLAPECISKSEYGAPSDVWALGCTVAEMLLGKPARAYADDLVADQNELLDLIGAGLAPPEIPVNMSAWGRDFLSRCFEVDPRKRWTAEMLLRHPYVADLDILIHGRTSSSSVAVATATSSSNASELLRFLPHETSGPRRVR